MDENEYRQLVKEQIAADVYSLELKYQVISDCYNKYPFAFRAETIANSVYLGRLTQADYSYATDKSEDVGIRLAKWSVISAIRDINDLLEVGKKPAFVSVRCPAALADTDDLYKEIKTLTDRYGLKDKTRLCLEFSQSLLYLTGEKAAKNITDMKILGVQTMVTGVGAYDCPASKLLEIPVDWCMIDPMTTRLSADPDKPRVVSTFSQYLKSMDVKLLAEDAENDDQVNTLMRLDYAGVTAAKSYQGAIKYPVRGASIEEIAKMAEKP